MGRKLLLLALLLASLVACAADDTPSQGSGLEGDVTTITLVTPASGDNPNIGESAYPVAPVDAVLPTEYPGVSVTPPPAQIDPSELYPAPSESGAQVMPPPLKGDLDTYPQLGPFLEALTIDVSERAAVPVDEVSLLAYESLTWPNGGLGCPAEGVGYIEQQVDGFQVTFGANGATYTYHTDGTRNYVLCRDGVRLDEGTVIGR